jgi:hypothetical protein
MTPRAVVLAGCGPHAAASHRAHPTEASARSTARAHFERTEIGSICAHMGPEDGDNSNARASVRRSAQRTHCEPIAFSKFKITFTRHDVRKPQNLSSSVRKRTRSASVRTVAARGSEGRYAHAPARRAHLSSSSPVGLQETAALGQKEVPTIRRVPTSRIIISSRHTSAGR